ncbi:hypothetical protein [Methylobacterium sp. Leaf125]|uniref:hypothetical protein n=1 Tax=Methylobacterium sp. Leaf125 TaxID=1736265 RepID=UPI000AD412EC|nr:hypothetical protein [Methylobacterium sp. Leaf125]
MPKDIKDAMPPFMQTGIEQWVRDNPDQARARLLKVCTEMLAMLGASVPTSAINTVMDAEADKWGAVRLPHLD